MRCFGITNMCLLPRLARPWPACRAAWCLLVGPASGWAVLTGGAAAALLYLHLSRGIGPEASGAYNFGGSSGGAGQHSSGGSGGNRGAPVVHLRNTVPAGATEAVARVLKVCWSRGWALVAGPDGLAGRSACTLLLIPGLPCHASQAHRFLCAPSPSPPQLQP